MALNRSRKRKNDPTGQASRRRKATRALVRRLDMAEGAVKRLFRDIPATRRTIAPIRNQETVFYDYDLTPAERTQLEIQIAIILGLWLETTGDAPPSDWFWADEIEPPYRQGAMEEVSRANQLIAAAIVAGLITDPFVQQIPVEQVINSVEYQTALRDLVVKNHSTITSLSERTSAQVIQEINSGTRAGLSPNEVAKNITERFNVSKSSAKRIADTEINRAYNDAKLDSVRIIETQTGQRSGVLHISALLPTTRTEHAARHSKVAFCVSCELAGPRIRRGSGVWGRGSGRSHK